MSLRDILYALQVREESLRRIGVSCGVLRAVIAHAEEAHALTPAMIQLMAVVKEYVEVIEGEVRHVIGEVK